MLRAINREQEAMAKATTLNWWRATKREEKAAIYFKKVKNIGSENISENN